MKQCAFGCQLLHVVGHRLREAGGFVRIERRVVAFAHAVFGQSADKVRTAIIGTGNRGSYLLQGVLLQSKAQGAALCDIKPDRLDKAATALLTRKYRAPYIVPEKV